LLPGKNFDDDTYVVGLELLTFVIAPQQEISNEDGLSLRSSAWSRDKEEFGTIIEGVLKVSTVSLVQKTEGFKTLLVKNLSPIEEFQNNSSSKRLTELFKNSVLYVSLDLVGQHHTLQVLVPSKNIK
jgi:hypothetical protein